MIDEITINGKETIQRTKENPIPTKDASKIVIGTLQTAAEPKNVNITLSFAFFWYST